ncbi:MAG: 16S rRNA (adenine(1518)-N(6)/adenine(1519)-N(6))-dimethyltransferase RsmA [bacterium]|nr:16S rRNA (adenine(1518)-N(6)/adenine(1519)-N(6))-dimethyltransferase RsmA [bacterium]
MRARIGQHFLKDASVARRIVCALPIAEHATVIEVGPGKGALTAFLAERVGEVPEAELVCIERDPALAAALAAQSQSWRGVLPTVHTGDVRTLLREVVRSVPRTRRYAIIGNLPYYLTGHLFRILGELPRLPEAAVFMVQREVAERLAAVPPCMNMLAASVQAWAKPSILFRVPPSAFSPKPSVESAVVSLVAVRTTPPPAEYYRAARTLFRQPRKTILNNLAAEIGRTDAVRILTEAGLNPSDRPQTLSPDKILLLSKHPPFTEAAGDV